MNFLKNHKNEALNILMFHCNDDLNIKLVEKQSEMTPVQWAFFMKGYPVYQQKLKEEMEKDQKDNSNGIYKSYSVANKAKGIGR